MIRPGHYSWAYPSSMVSKYYAWFVLMNYPELDILEYPDGEWHVIQYYNAPIIPSMTKWQTVLGPMRNVEISYGFLEKYTKQLDITRKVFWERENRKSKEVEEESQRVERHRQDSVNLAHQAITRNPNLMERIAKNDLKEMDLSYIAKHVPKTEL